MPQQTKLLVYAQERYDLPDKNLFQDLMEIDFQTLQKGLVSGAESFVLKGFVVSHIAPPSLQISVSVANSVLLHGGYNGSFFVAPSTSSPLTALATDGTTTYFWLELGTEDGTPATRTFWDPALQDGVGAEFSQIVNTQQTLVVTLNKNTTGFPVSGNVIHLCKTVAVAGTITSFIDCRKLLFRLGTGGNSPDIDNTYPWSAGRTEPGTTGTTAVFAGGDKQLYTLKDAFDAITSVIKEMKWGTATGTGAVWYAPTPSTLSSMDIAMTEGGTWAWDLGTTSLSFTADVSFLIPGTAFINTIAVASSPIVLPANGDVAYVDIDRTSNAALVPVVVASASYAPQADRVIVARRLGDVAWVGIS